MKLGSKSFLVVANWKMNRSFKEEVAFGSEYRGPLEQLQNFSGIQIVVCPSFVSLSSLHECLCDTGVALGAQDCSPYAVGAYTGQVSAHSLCEVGCTYCIVGHSEWRQYCNGTDEVIGKKIQQLFDHGIIPIVCIGESEIERERGHTKAALKQQVDAAFGELSGSLLGKRVYVAYEPIWAIGTGKTPSKQELEETILYLREMTHMYDAQMSLLYGGSVSAENAKEIASIGHIEGFLVGSASLDFQKFQKIVSLVNT